MSTSRLQDINDCISCTPSTSSRRNEDSEKPSKRCERDLKVRRSRTTREIAKSLLKLRNPVTSVYSQLRLSKNDPNFLHIFVTLGVSSDITIKRTYPALWNLYKNGLLPPNIRFYGFARAPMTAVDLRECCAKYMLVLPEEELRYDEFWKLSNYYIGSYLVKMDYEAFNREMSNFGTLSNFSNRLFYMALPNATLEHVAPLLKIITNGNHNINAGSKGWTRVIVEKPFGYDIDSCKKIAQQLLSIFREEEIYRIDCFLGKQVLQNLITIRFANFLLSSTWNRNYIQAVLITLKEPYGVRASNKCLDSYGIIRDVMQSHMLQFLCLIAMEKPLSMQPNDIRDEKVKVLRCIPPVKMDDVVLGQYYGTQKLSDNDDRQNSYLDEPNVPKNSLMPTFCTAVLKIKNERWDGVPFILKCGKAMNEKLTSIRIQYKDTPGQIFDGKLERNEIVIQIEPNESLYLKAITKPPTAPFSSDDKDVIFGHYYRKTQNVFERLLLDVLCGSQMHFIRSDELIQSSRVFASLLRQIEDDRIKPILYKIGSEGPKEAADLIRKNKFYIYD